MDRILVGYDGSPPARRALDHAVARAGKSGDELVLLTVIPPGVRNSSLSGMMPAGIELPSVFEGTFEHRAQERLKEVMQAFAKSGARIRTEVRTGTTPEALLALADEMRVNEIVIGHKSYEGPGFTLGPNADAIVRGAKVPVTVVR